MCRLQWMIARHVFEESYNRSRNQNKGQTLQARESLRDIDTLDRHIGEFVESLLRRMKEGLRLRAKGDASNGVDGPKKTNGTIATGVDQPFSVEKTDHSLWRLKVEHGRQTWHYITREEAETWPQSIPEKHHLGMETVVFLLSCS
jgi:hypothetical protein